MKVSLWLAGLGVMLMTALSTSSTVFAATSTPPPTDASLIPHVLNSSILQANDGDECTDSDDDGQCDVNAADD